MVHEAIEEEGLEPGVCAPLGEPVSLDLVKVKGMAYCPPDMWTEIHSEGTVSRGWGRAR